MITNWENFGVEETERYFDFAVAYLKASEDVCCRMLSQEQEMSWANASVDLMLSVHSLELFLKGALSSKGVQNYRGHNIDDLHSKYRKLFPSEQFLFDCPFVTEYIGFSDR